MFSIMLAWILSLQMVLSTFTSPMITPAILQSSQAGNTFQESRLFWGLIDPELSLWFSRVPPSTRDTNKTVLWDFSWRTFLSALFAQPITEEAPIHATQI